MNILVPKKHLGKSFPQICSLKKLSSSVASGEPNSDCNVYIFPYYNLISKNDYEKYKCMFNICYFFIFILFSSNILIPRKIDKIIPTPRTYDIH